MQCYRWDDFEYPILRNFAEGGRIDYAHLGNVSYVYFSTGEIVQRCLGFGLPFYFFVGRVYGFLDHFVPGIVLVYRITGLPLSCFSLLLLTTYPVEATQATNAGRRYHYWGAEWPLRFRCISPLFSVNLIYWGLVSH